MIDASTRQPLRVSTDGTAGPYIMVSVEQVDDVRRLLADAGIACWVDSMAIALDGQPAFTVINFGRGADSNRIQSALNDKK